MPLTVQLVIKILQIIFPSTSQIQSQQFKKSWFYTVSQLKKGQATQITFEASITLMSKPENNIQ